MRAPQAGELAPMINEHGGGPDLGLSQAEETPVAAPWLTVVGPAAQPSPLPVLLTVLDEFRRQNLSYCYWKSGQRVHAVLRGESDLDLLVSRGDQHHARHILLAQGFKQFADVAGRDHPAVSSYLGYDEPSGLIVHLHMHFRLVVGEKLLKNYRLPWEAVVLDRAVWHPALPIRVLDPASEALLLVARSVLEFDRLDPIALRHWASTRQKFELDRQRLAACLDRATLGDRAGEVFVGDLPDLIVEGFFGGRLDSDRRLRRRIRTALAARRAFNGAEARLRSLARTALWAAGGLNERLLHRPRPARRRAPGGGCVVAVIGVDGSGKSSVVAAIRTWLRPEVDIMPVYFGTGDGRPALLLLPLKLMVPMITRLLRTKPRGASHGRVSSRPPGALYTLFMMVWAAAVAAEKRGKLLAAHRGASRGLVVVSDRYPQNEDVDYNDGPLLPRLPRAPRWLRRYEAGAYELASRLAPDLVIKLEVTPQTAAQREPNMDPAVLRQRIKAARHLTLCGSRIVRVDAEQPLAAVIRAVKQEIWRTL